MVKLFHRVVFSCGQSMTKSLSSLGGVWVSCHTALLLFGGKSPAFRCVVLLLSSNPLAT